MNTTIYLKARSFHKVMNGMTPDYAWSGQKPSMSDLKVFGCIAYA
jgi:hypothetical protein